METQTLTDKILNGFEPIHYYYLRYVIIAGFFYLLYYVINKDNWIHKKIQKKFPQNENILFEIKYSIINLALFAAMGFFVAYTKTLGWTKLYGEVSEYGWPYLIFSVVALILFHDTYFYWAHRFMHLKWVYPHVHLVHHKSTSPTPWASFSFHPIEGFLEAVGVLALVYIMPLHMYAVWSFLIFMTVFNVLGHLGYEIFPYGTTRSKKWGWHNTVTHHDMHHKHFNSNYGIYFNWWDKWMGTNHKDYHKVFDSVAGAKPARKEAVEKTQEPLEPAMGVSPETQAA